jgi:hypothetical protein
MNTAQQNDDRLINLFTQLAGALVERGLAHARNEDPHTYNQAAKWVEAGGGKFQLRIDIDTGERNITTRAMVVDAGDEALIQVFAIEGKLAGGDH